ncbi:MAG TPA: hypothetical protein VNX68_10340, partial [Nitrosopumilaceae archaeon]|nr:hypothetical protein [Nitrosopumilaceae archaeon]
MAKILSLIFFCLCGHINAQNAKYHSTFHIEKLYVDSNRIHWTTTDESGSLPFQVEQYLCGTWKKVGEIIGKG